MFPPLLPPPPPGFAALFIEELALDEGMEETGGA